MLSETVEILWKDLKIFTKLNMDSFLTHEGICLAEMKSQKSSKSLRPTEVEHSREICSRETNQALLYVASSTKGDTEHHDLFQSNLILLFLLLLPVKVEKMN